MKLIYRGQSYHYDPSKAPERPICSTPYTLHYRGVTYQVSPKSKTEQQSAQSATHQLICGGNAYPYDPATASAFPTTHQRGVTYQIVPKSEMAQEPMQSRTSSTYQLHYRGVTYLVDRNASGDAISAEDNSNRVTPKHNLLNFGASFS